MPTNNYSCEGKSVWHLLNLRSGYKVLDVGEGMAARLVQRAWIKENIVSESYWDASTIYS